MILLYRILSVSCTHSVFTSLPEWYIVVQHPYRFWYTVLCVLLVTWMIHCFTASLVFLVYCTASLVFLVHCTVCSPRYLNETLLYSILSVSLHCTVCSPRYLNDILLYRILSIYGTLYSVFSSFPEWYIVVQLSILSVSDTLHSVFTWLSVYYIAVQ